MKYPVTNNTAMPIYVAGLMIPPGETRHFELGQLPPEFRPAPEVAEPDAPKDRIAEIAAMSVKLIVAILADLSEEDLARLLEIEQAGQARKSLIAAIAERQLKIAEEKTANSADPLANLAGKPLEEILPLIAEMPAEDLTRLAEIEQSGEKREELLTAIAERQVALAGQGNE